MTRWQLRPVPFKFQLSDWTLFTVSRPLQVRAERLIDETPPVSIPHADTNELEAGSAGFLIRGLPIAEPLPAISEVDDFICYVPLQYHHSHIDLGLGFEAYQQKFSAKTRATINRKTRKFAEQCGGEVSWKTYRTPGEMREFFAHAGELSRLTYQARLLDAGIPDSEAFVAEAEQRAADNAVRAYLLFDGSRAVSYLYCPAEDGVLIYAYLGYDPAYMKHSVGTVLQWLALEQLFDEAEFRYFDFTEGQSEHKRLFATHQRRCANVYLLRKTVGHRVLVRAHHVMNQFSTRLGSLLSELGIKSRLKRYLRFAR